jgi:glycosyltransferase involved in cell wall biosynthesis
MLDPWFRQAYPLKHLKKLCYWQLFEYKVFSDAEAVLFTSNEEQDKARHSFWPYKGHGEVVGLGTTAPAGNPAAYSELFLSNYPELRERPFLLFLGRIHPKKGCDLLLRAMVAVSSQHPQACLVIAGPESDQYARLLKEQISPEIAQNVVWTGALAGDLKWGALNSAEALVLPSHQENFGMVVAEALACGRPVLLSDKVNTWHDVLEHGAGLVEEDTIDGTRNLLERWFAMSSAEKQAMAERAKQCFSKSFDIRIAHARLIESLERAISSHGS